jgi:phosphoribosylglycinamide formyltransferase-1
MTRKRAVIFISGGGSNMAALIEAARENDYPVEFVAVISDHEQAGGLAKAAAQGIRTAALERRNFASKAEHERAILDLLAEIKPDLICLAGYMRLLSADFIAAYEHRIVNIHPALLPLFPGLHTHQRALDAGMKVAGCSVHYVTEGVDDGPVIAQAVVPVLDGDTAETLAARVLTAEHLLYKEAVRKVAGGKFTTDSGAQLHSLG